MGRTANQLIIDTYRLSGIIAQQDAIPAYLTDQALTILNDIITEWAGDNTAIPYQTEVTFNTVQNQERYTFGNSNEYDVNTDPLIDILSFYYYINPANGNNIRQNMQVMTEQMYANIVFTELPQYPSEYLLRKFPKYSELIIQPLPQLAFECVLVCKQRFPSVTLFTDLEEIFPQNFFVNLKYRLFADICDANGVELLPYQVEKRKEANQAMKASNKIDLGIRKGESLSRSRGWWNWTIWTQGN